MFCSGNVYYKFMSHNSFAGTGAKPLLNVLQEYESPVSKLLGSLEVVGFDIVAELACSWLGDMQASRRVLCSGWGPSLRAACNLVDGR